MEKYTLLFFFLPAFIIFQGDFRRGFWGKIWRGLNFYPLSLFFKGISEEGFEERLDGGLTREPFRLLWAYEAE